MPDVSQRQVEIRYSFSGAELLLFGAILYPGGRAPGAGADVAVVLKGPLERIVLREKQKVAGIWMNVERVRFRSAPSFYAVASSRPLSRLVDERTAAIYELGLDNLQLSPGGGASADVLRRFEQGLIDLRRRNQLYAEYPRGVEISEGVLYRARITIPARVPVGTYTAETFLIRDGRVDRRRGARDQDREAGLRALHRRRGRALVAGLRHRRGRAVAAARLGGERLLPAPLRLRASHADALNRQALVYPIRLGPAGIASEAPDA